MTSSRDSHPHASPAADERRPSRGAMAAHAAFLLVYILWGINMSSMKIGGREWDPFLFNGLRFLCIVPLLWAYTYFYYRRHSLRFRIEARHLLLILGLGALSSVGIETMLSYALQYTSTANAAVIGRGFVPIMTVAYLLMRRRISLTWRLSLGLPLAFAAAIVIVAGSHGLRFGADTWRGDGLLLLRSAFTTAYLLGMSRLLGNYPLALLIPLEMTGAAVALLPAVILKLDAATLGAVTTEGWTSFIFTTLFATLLGFSLHNWSLGRLGPFKASAYGYTQPFFAAVAGFFILHESLTLWQWIGGFGVLMAMALVQHDRMRSQKAGVRPAHQAQEGGGTHAAHDVRRTEANG